MSECNSFKIKKESGVLNAFIGVGVQLLQNKRVSDLELISKSLFGHPETRTEETRCLRADMIRLQAKAEPLAA